MESRLHWVRDVIFQEDRSQIRTKVVYVRWQRLAIWRLIAYA